MAGIEDKCLKQSEEPGWLSAKVDQRIALMADKMGGAPFPEGALITTPLTEPREGATREEFERWDRSCDGCGAFVPIGEILYTGSCLRKYNDAPVVITFGACAKCWES